MIFVTIVELTIGLIIFLYLYISSKVMLSVYVLIGFVFVELISFNPGFIFIYTRHKKLTSVYPYLDNLYIFEYRLKKSIDNKYKISFEYERQKLDIISSDLGNDELDNTLVRVGYIKELDRVIILEKISR